MSNLFGDPRRSIKSHNAAFVVAESQIRKGLQFSNYINRAARHIGVSEYRFKIWAAKYLDAETGLTLLELQQRNLLIEKANRVGTEKKKRGDGSTPFSNRKELSEDQIREAMSISNSNKEASEFLHVTSSTYKKYASMYIDDETGMTLYELQHQKWKKINYERFIARKEAGYFEKLKERKAKWQAQKFKKGEVPWSERPEDWKYKGLQLSEDVVRNAIKNTRSNKEAASWLRIGYKTWKKYAKSYIDPVSGRTLFDLHTAVGGKGVPKVMNPKNRANPVALELGYQLIKGQYSTPKRVGELTKRLMKDGRLGFCCAECGFAQKRPIDMKMPLLINFKNNDRSDWREENLQWLCYNCSFLLALDYTTRTSREILQSIAPESPDAPDEVKSFYNIDDFYLEHLKSLGVKDLSEDVKPQIEKDEKNPDIDDLINYI
jgi:hypothetical protein